MKRPISVTIASILYFILTALSCVTFIGFAIYTPDEFLSNLSEAYPFLPPLLSVILSVILVALPIFIATGVLSGTKLSRWLAVLYAVASIGSMLLYIEYYEQSKIIFQWVLQAVLLLLLFNPPANRYFAAQDPKE
ncbi:hypothetical protein [Haemophilus sputorum]|uniref:hypothetical protein n=1 Tax=Haemophilus sputorum TaxID=1078480 RepID=UPI0028D397DF|nr:hypothetical protein [Haemophilus sputorum]